TAQTSFVETAATALRPSDPVLGLGTMLQLVPFQCSISVWRSPLLVPWYPTAQTSFVETAATPLRSPGVELGTTLQLVPSQCSTSVPTLLAYPTVQTSLAETAATLESWLPYDPALGLAIRFQPGQVTTAQVNAA